MTAFLSLRLQRSWPVLARMMPISSFFAVGFWLEVEERMESTRLMAEPTLIPPGPPMMRCAKMPMS